MINEVSRFGGSRFQAITQYAFPPLPAFSWSTTSMGRSGVEFEVEGEAGIAGLEVKRAKKASIVRCLGCGLGVAWVVMPMSGAKDAI